MYLPHPLYPPLLSRRGGIIKKRGFAPLDTHIKTINIVYYFRGCNMDIDELSKKIDKYHEEDRKRADKSR